MIKIGVSTALERRIRALASEQTPGTIFAELVELIDNTYQANKARALKAASDGIAYPEVVSIFREVLGDKLVVPSNPSREWIGRIVRRLREYGFRGEAVRQLATACLATPRRTYDLEYSVRYALDILERARTPGAGVEKCDVRSVRTGREALDE